MKTSRALLAAITLGLALGAMSAPASAHGYYHGGYWGGPRVTFGFYGGPYWWGPGYWGPGWGGYYAPPPVVVVPSEPCVYVERDSIPSTGQQQWWYWCASAKGYYPYVSTCSEGWQRVAPQPQAAQ